MSCTTGLQPECTAFYEGKNGTTVTIRFGFYLNWGRPNYNCNRVDPIKNALLKLGFSVQMSLDQETSDYVSLQVDDKEIVRNDNLQHNKNFRGADILREELVEEFNSSYEVAK